MIMHKTMEDPSIEPGIFLENTRNLADLSAYRGGFVPKEAF